MNFVFLAFSLVPLAVAVYFIAKLNEHLNAEGNWLLDCDKDSQDSIIKRLEWNRIYYYVLAVVTLLRIPQWFFQGVNFFRKVAIWMWLLHALLIFFNLATIWMVNAVLNSSTCPDSVLKNTDVFGWDSLKA